MTFIKRTAIIFAPLMLTGCALTKWVVDNQQSIEGAGDTAEGFGPYGAIASLAITTAVGLAKWVEHKSTTKELVQVMQKAKKDLDPEAKKVLVKAFDTHMPTKLKKIVAKIKGK